MGYRIVAAGHRAVGVVLSVLFSCNLQGCNSRSSESGGSEPAAFPTPDYGIPETAGSLDDPVCYRFRIADSYHLDPAEVRDGSTAGDFCTLRTHFESAFSDYGGRLALGSLAIVGIEVLGFYSSEPPNESMLRVVGVADALSVTGAYPLTEHSYPYLGNFYSSELAADDDPSSFDSIEWFASGDASEAAGLNACTPDCVWEDIYLEIRDPVRALASDCNDYLTEPWVCFEFERVDSNRELQRRRGAQQDQGPSSSRARPGGPGRPFAWDRRARWR